MIKAAICGMGSWGQTLINSVQGKSDKIQFTAGVVRSLEKYSAYAEKQGLSLTSRMETVLADPAIDAVILATPHSLHAEQVKLAAAAGKHVFVEKPMTLTRESAQAVVDACIDAGVTFSVGHNRRFLPAMVDMKKMIAEGKIGKILHIEGHHSGPSGYRAKAGSWRADRLENPAGGMAPRGIHTLDAMIHLCGVVDSVFCMSERREISVDLDDTTSMLLRFKNGATGYLATVIATANCWRLHVFGSKGWIEMNGPKTLTVKDLEDHVEQKPFDDFDIQKAELEAFAEAAHNKETFLFPPEEAVNGIAVLDAMVKSAKVGSVVRVEQA